MSNPTASKPMHKKPPHGGMGDKSMRNLARAFVDEVLERLGVPRPLLTERHIYIRGKSSRVQFVAISPLQQVGLLLFALVFGSWVGYASVQTLFGTGIAAIKARQFQDVQANYEQQISKMRQSYNRLSDKNRLTQNWFLDAISRMEERHNRLLQLLEKRAGVSDRLREMRKQVGSNAAKFVRTRGKTELIAAIGQANYAYLDNLPPAERVEVALMAWNAQAAKGAEEQSDDTQSASQFQAAFPQGVVDRVHRLHRQQKALANMMEAHIDQDVQTMLSVMRSVRIGDVDALVQRMAPESRSWAKRLTGGGLGGPYISSDVFSQRDGGNAAVRDQTRDAAMDAQMARIDRSMDRLHGLTASIARLPLTMPLFGGYITSGFGPRVDPFTKKSAMHSGLDFAAKPATPIFSTLPGRVTRAGDRGPYGLMVEIDHGNGFRTRYAHLASVGVKVGQRVRFQQQLGTIGSSGRSTGTHLHYEIWLDDKVIDPKKFIEYGQHIFALPIS